MAGRSYPIWCGVWSPEYLDPYSKGYGTRTQTDTTVRVGASARHSRELVRTSVHKVPDGEYDRFEFLVDLLDGKGWRVVQRKWFNPDTKEFHNTDPRPLLWNRELPDMYAFPEAE